MNQALSTPPAATEPFSKVRPYTSDDFATVAAWWKAHKDEELHEAILPPLGVIVEDSAGPACALFCYESFGVGVAFLEMPCTRPGIRPAYARWVFNLAVNALVNAAGQCCDPPGKYTVFRAQPSASLWRGMQSLGFVRDSEEEFIPCHFTRKESE